MDRLGYPIQPKPISVLPAAAQQAVAMYLFRRRFRCNCRCWATRCCCSSRCKISCCSAAMRWRYCAATAGSMRVPLAAYKRASGLRTGVSCHAWCALWLRLGSAFCSGDTTCIVVPCLQSATAVGSTLCSSFCRRAYDDCDGGGGAVECGGGGCDRATGGCDKTAGEWEKCGGACGVELLARGG